MQDTEKKRKPGSGGKREGSGRKKGIEKPVVAITIDQANKDWVDQFGIGRSFSDKVNRILTAHRERIEQMHQDVQDEIF